MCVCVLCTGWDVSRARVCAVAEGTTACATGCVAQLRVISFPPPQQHVHSGGSQAAYVLACLSLSCRGHVFAAEAFTSVVHMCVYSPALRSPSSCVVCCWMLQAAADAPTPQYSADFIRRRLIVFVGIVLG